MRGSTICLGFLLLLGNIVANAQGSGDPEAIAARRILEAWQSKHAAPRDRSLHVICWTPSDREFPSAYHERLSRILRHVQRFYADEMERHGFRRRGFQLKVDADDRVVIHDVRGKHPRSHYGKQSGSAIREECVPVLKKAGIDVNGETIALFCNLATWDPKTLTFTHDSPYYAGGDAFRGTAWQLDSPELDVRNLELKTPLVRDGQYGRISLGRHNSIFIGGIAHELGHAFGLPHCEERPDEAARGTSLMGSGNRTYGEEIRGEGRGTFLTFAHALRLASHPQFSGFVETSRSSPHATVEQLSITAQGEEILVSGIVQGEPPVYGVVAYFDPEGNGDYNATTSAAVPNADGRFSLRTKALSRGKKGALRLIPLHSNGAASPDELLSRLRFAYKVAEDGVPDLSAIHARQELKPLIDALLQGDRTLATKRANDIKDMKASAIAVRLLRNEPPSQTPAQFSGKEPTRSLTDFKPSLAQVGWMKPAYDRIPESSMLLECEGKIDSTGIYAHAPARHEYDLGGQWKSFKGRAGLAAGHPGTVVFEILGDGRSLWKSDVVREDLAVSFEVDVQGVRRLELLTAATEDGPTADWGLWLGPRLSRDPAIRPR